MGLFLVCRVVFRLECKKEDNQNRLNIFLQTTFENYFAILKYFKENYKKKVDSSIKKDFFGF